MNDRRDEDFVKLLDRCADQYTVSAAPVTDILDNYHRARRQRTVLRAVLAVAVAVVVAALGVPAILGPSPRPAAPTDGRDTDLDGSWTVTRLAGAQPEQLPKRYRGKVVLTFSAGQMVGHTGCNGISSSYEQDPTDGATITFHGEGSTLVACTHEPPMIDQLGLVRYVAGSGDTRYLLDSAQHAVVTMQRQSPLATYVPAPDTNGGDAAMLRGTLRLDRGCLSVSGVIALFPTPMYSWDSGRLIGPAQTYRAGDVVELSGGHSTWRAVDKMADTHLPAGCDTSKDFFVVNALR